MGKIDIRIEDWKRKLIDLTRRNRLLFFKPARSSSLKVIEPSPSEVFRRFTVEEKPWKFFVPFAENEEQDKFGPDLMLGSQQMLKRINLNPRNLCEDPMSFFARHERPRGSEWFSVTSIAAPGVTLKSVGFAFCM